MLILRILRLFRLLSRLRIRTGYIKVQNLSIFMHPVRKKYQKSLKIEEKSSIKTFKKIK